VKIFFPNFKKKLILLCLIRLEPSKKGGLERDVIQMDIENLDSGGGDPIIGYQKK